LIEKKIKNVCKIAGMLNAYLWLPTAGREERVNAATAATWSKLFRVTAHFPRLQVDFRAYHANKKISVGVLFLVPKNQSCFRIQIGFMILPD
jgi:hypothetical protein